MITQCRCHCGRFLWFCTLQQKAVFMAVESASLLLPCATRSIFILWLYVQLLSSLKSRCSSMKSLQLEVTICYRLVLRDNHYLWESSAVITHSMQHDRSWTWLHECFIGREMHRGNQEFVSAVPSTSFLPFLLPSRSSLFTCLPPPVSGPWNPDKGFGERC